MSNTNSTTPTRPTDSQATDYEVPDSLEDWERFNRLVGKALETPRENLLPANNDMKEQNRAAKQSGSS